MALLIKTTPGNQGFDMRTLDFDGLTAGMTVVAANPFIIRWQPGTGTDYVNLLGDQLTGSSVAGLGGVAITQIQSANSDPGNPDNEWFLNIAGLSFSVQDFVDLVQAKDWAGLADYVQQGDDSIVGTKNNDTLQGGDGDDSFSSGLGRDLINGGAGNDTMQAMGGHDVMRGGIGADMFQFGEVPIPGEDWSVTIKDFKTGADRIAVSDVVFNDVGFGGFDGAVMAAVHFHLGRSAKTEDHAMVYNQTKGLLYYDPDGVGGAGQVLLAKLGAGTVLTFADMWVL